MRGKPKIFPFTEVMGDKKRIFRKGKKGKLKK